MIEVTLFLYMHLRQNFRLFVFIPLVLARLYIYALFAIP